MASQETTSSCGVPFNGAPCQPAATNSSMADRSARAAPRGSALRVWEYHCWPSSAAASRWSTTATPARVDATDSGAPTKPATRWASSVGPTVRWPHCAGSPSLRAWACQAVAAPSEGRRCRWRVRWIMGRTKETKKKGVQEASVGSREIVARGARNTPGGRAAPPSADRPAHIPPGRGASGLYQPAPVSTGPFLSRAWFCPAVSGDPESAKHPGHAASGCLRARERRSTWQPLPRRSRPQRLPRQPWLLPRQPWQQPPPRPSWRPLRLPCGWRLPRRPGPHVGAPARPRA